MWRNPSRLRTPKKDSRGRLSYIIIEAASEPSRPSPFILGLLQAVKFSDTPFDLLRPRDRGVRLKTA